MAICHTRRTRRTRRTHHVPRTCFTLLLPSRPALPSALLKHTHTHRRTQQPLLSATGGTLHSPTLSTGAGGRGSALTALAATIGPGAPRPTGTLVGSRIHRWMW